MNIGAEFWGSDLGDERLDERLHALAELLGQRPSQAFTAIGNKAEVEALYRFLRNAKTGLDEILAPHIERTRRRAETHKRVIVPHDTTEFRFPGERKGLGRIDRADKGAGFLGHTSFVISLDKREPLGIIGFEPWVRDAEKKTKRTRNRKLRDPERESTRWLKGIREADDRLGRDVYAIHVEDREGDMYEQLALAQLEKRHFVIRAAHNRRLESPDDDREYLWDALEGFEDKAKRKATLTRRVKTSPGHPARKERTAKLKISAGTVTLRRPKKEKSILSEAVEINVVRVYEPKPPVGTEPVEWVLLTSESVETKSDIEQIVDIYCTRWMIEEFFKALKTGCQIEKRQLKSLKTILTALGLFIPLAWSLLALRHKSRETPDDHAPDFEPGDIELLAKLNKMSEAPPPTAANYYKLIAALGGHWSSNGPPGWLVLYRGYERFLLAKSIQAVL